VSKLARKPIDIASLDVSLTDGVLRVKGKKGELSLKIKDGVSLDILDTSLQVECNDRAILGLHCALIRNMVKGVTEGFTETLTLKGVGYRVALSNKDLNFNLGYSHPVVFTLPEGISAEIVNPTELKLSGIDKQKVGQVAANIISLRPAKKDPYKEKGIKRIQDRIIKKVGKKVK
jgi:large subunit ribosomal protein L6